MVKTLAQKHKLANIAEQLCRSTHFTAEEVSEIENFCIVNSFHIHQYSTHLILFIFIVNF